MRVPAELLNLNCVACTQIFVPRPLARSRWFFVGPSFDACEPVADGQQVSSAMQADSECQDSRKAENPPFDGHAHAEPASAAVPRPLARSRCLFVGPSFDACEPVADGQQVSSAMQADSECQDSRKAENPSFDDHAYAKPASSASRQMSGPDCDRPEVFQACSRPHFHGPVTSPSSHVPGSGPLLIELCAGSANLSSVAAMCGFSIMPVDNAFNRHRPKAKVVSLDLRKPHAWDILNWTIRHRDVAMAHAALPCRTCSAARGIRLKDGTSGLPVLRASEHP